MENGSLNVLVRATGTRRSLGFILFLSIARTETVGDIKSKILSEWRSLAGCQLNETDGLLMYKGRRLDPRHKIADYAATPLREDNREILTVEFEGSSDVNCSPKALKDEKLGLQRSPVVLRVPGFVEDRDKFVQLTPELPKVPHAEYDMVIQGARYRAQWLRILKLVSQTQTGS